VSAPPDFPGRRSFLLLSQGALLRTLVARCSGIPPDQDVRSATRRHRHIGRCARRTPRRALRGSHLCQRRSCAIAEHRARKTAARNDAAEMSASWRSRPRRTFAQPGFDDRRFLHATSRHEFFGPIAGQRPMVDASPVPFRTPVDRVVPPRRGSRGAKGAGHRCYMTPSGACVACRRSVRNMSSFERRIVVGYSTSVRMGERTAVRVVCVVPT
jgi:hypothetical protein